MAHQEGREIVAVHPQRLSEVEGVNNRLQLARTERVYRAEQAEKLLLAGVMLRDPARFDLRGTLQHGRDVEIDTNVILEGRIVLGDRVKIGAGCVIKTALSAMIVKSAPTAWWKMPSCRRPAPSAHLPVCARAPNCWKAPTLATSWK